MSLSISGDPASCSQAGGSLRRLATTLRDGAERATSGFDAAGDAWSGAVATRTRRTQASLAEAAGVAGDELDRVGSQLQDHAADLAEAVQAARHVEDRAAAAGLRVVDGRVVPAWGVHGIADGQSARAQDDASAVLQAELDTALRQIGRRRARLVALLEGSGQVLADQAARLRR